MRVLGLLVFALLALHHSPAVAATLYKCTGNDGVPNYVRAPLADMDCEIISQYTPTASRWQYVGMTQDPAVISIDKETMDRNKSGFSAWVQYLAQPGKTLDMGNGKWSNKLLHRYRVECSARTMATVSYVGYTESGNVIDSGSYLTPMPAPIIPGSVGEMIWASGCKSPVSP